MHVTWILWLLLAVAERSAANFWGDWILGPRALYAANASESQSLEPRGNTYSAMLWGNEPPLDGGTFYVQLTAQTICEEPGWYEAQPTEVPGPDVTMSWTSSKAKTPEIDIMTGGGKGDNGWWTGGTDKYPLPGVVSSMTTPETVDISLIMNGSQGPSAECVYNNTACMWMSVGYTSYSVATVENGNKFSGGSTWDIISPNTNNQKTYLVLDTCRASAGDNYWVAGQTHTPINLKGQSPTTAAGSPNPT